MPCFRVITNKTPNGIPITAPKNKAIDTIYSVSYNACNNCALSKSEPNIC